MKQALTIEGMHCGGCVAKVKRVLESMPGVAAASVYLPNSGIIDCSARIPIAQIEEALANVGSYTVTPGQPSIFAGLRQFAPLITMFGFVLVWATVLTFPIGHHWTHDWMRHFMGGFFLLFGGLKVVNLRGFALMYRGYDLLAARVPAWGYIYPFAEVLLGVLYTVDTFPWQTNVAAAALMLFGVVGIMRKLNRGGDQTCACLGGFFSVPLTRVTVAENVLMAAMAIWMLFFH